METILTVQMLQTTQICNLLVVLVTLNITMENHGGLKLTYAHLLIFYYSENSP